MSSSDLTKINRGDARRGTKITRNSFVSCTKRKRRAVATSCRDRSEFEDAVRGDDQWHAGNENNSGGSEDVCAGRV